MKRKKINPAIKYGYRSGLEDQVAHQLREYKIKVSYEEVKIKYVSPATNHIYTPDFLLPSGVFVETKGRFTIQDRKKHLLIKHQHPEVEIRFVFQSSKAKLYKGSKTTYADWCIKNGFIFADKLIPEGWLE